MGMANTFRELMAQVPDGCKVKGVVFNNDGLIKVQKECDAGNMLFNCATGNKKTYGGFPYVLQHDAPHQMAIVFHTEDDDQRLWTIGYGADNAAD